MQSNTQFLKYLVELKISLWLEGEKLRFRAPAGVMNDDIKRQLITRKPELIKLLQQRQAIESIELKAFDRNEPIPLTYAQQRLWFLDQLEPSVPSYNVCDAHPINHEIDIAALSKAMTSLIARHELLRTVFQANDGIPEQKILPPFEMTLPLVDLTHLDLGQAQQEALQIAADEAKKPFKLDSEPPLRVKLIKLATAKYIWLLSIHHIASDDWSKKTLNQEIEKLYVAYRDGVPPILPQLSIQWADFAIWQRRWLTGKNLDSHLDYWCERLAGEIPKLKLVEDNPRQIPANGANGKFYLPPSICAELRSFSEKEDVTLFMLLLASYGVLLQRYTRQDDFIIGTPISDRHQIETEGLIGFMLNTLPLRVQVPKGISFRELLAQVKETCLGAYSYQSVPYESLLQKLNVERTTNGNPMFDTMIILLNTPDLKLDKSELWGPDTLEPYPDITDDAVVYQMENSNGTTKFDLSISFIEHPKGIWGVTEYNQDVFDVHSIRGVIENLIVLLRSAMANPQSEVHELSMTTTAERERMLKQWSVGPVMDLPTQLIHQLVENQAAKNGDCIAIESPEENAMLSYGELNVKANHLAHYLVAQGVTPGSRVGVFLPRTLEQFVAILAILKTGAVYVPLDISCPIERMRLIVDDSAVKLMISTKEHSSVLPEGMCRFVLMDEVESAVAEQLDGNLDIAVKGEDASCILYTSGSTGKPKGVELNHVGVVNYVIGGAYDYGTDIGARMLQFASVAFDAFLEEAFVAFYVGAILVLRPERMLDSTEIFTGFLRQMDITTMVLPTAYWHELIATLDKYPLPERITDVVIGGERAIPEKLNQWQHHIDGRIRVFNTYGPTEGSIAITRALLPSAPEVDKTGHEVSIGHAVANTTIYILDENMEAVPQGVAGEVYLGGYAVANGYINRPEMTVQRFVNTTFLAKSERLYRTGDLARFLVDGSLQYLGRIDNQVKIRGNRVEPDEIGSLLQEHASVKDVVVLVREDHQSEKCLVAYFVPNADSELTGSELRNYLKPLVPTYMVPADFIELDMFPLNINGKVDKKALPAPSFSVRQSIYLAPRSEREVQLCGIWQVLLGIPSVGVNDNFFELGGHSLLATRIIARIKEEMGLDLPLRRLFESPTVSELAVTLDKLADSGNDDILAISTHPLPPLTASQQRSLFPLAFAQSRLWFLHQMEGAGRAYNVPIGLRLLGAVDVSMVKQVLNHIVERHESLRTQFIECDGIPMQQVVSAAEIGFEMTEQDLSRLSAPASALQKRISDFNNIQFDLSAGPLVRAKLVKLSSEEQLLLLVMHHIIADHWSIGLFIDEFKALYHAFVAGEPSPLSPLPVQFGDYARWQQDWFTGEVEQRHIEYWQRKLAGAPAQLQLATDYPRPAVQQFEGHAIDFSIDAHLTDGLRQISRKYGVSLYMAVMSAWVILLKKLSGERDVVVGTPSANRPKQETEQMIGFFINMLAIRVDLPDDLDVKSLLIQVRDTFLSAHEHQQLSFEQVVKAVSPTRSPAYSPLFQVIFSWQMYHGENTKSQVEPQSIVDIGKYDIGSVITAKYDLSLYMEEQRDMLVGNIEFATSLFKPERIERFISYFKKILEAMVFDAGQRVDSIDVLSSHERHSLLYHWNDTQVPYPQGERIYHLFERHAQSQPDAIALSCRGDIISYGELNGKANRLAKYLVEERGVKQEQFVGIYTDRSLDMVVAMLAILKAGGAYVPLDPEYPLSRLTYITDDTAVDTVLTQVKWRDQITPFGPDQAVFMDDASFQNQLSHYNSDNLDDKLLGLTDSHLAYVIYTSGSTGQPKGVMIEHRNSQALIRWSLDNFSKEELGCVLASTSMCFDLSIFELFVTLSSGGQAIIVENILALTEVPIEESLTMINTVPSGIRALLDSGTIPASVKTVNLAGEPLSTVVVNRLYDAGINKVYDLYGPSEDTTYSTFALRKRDGENTIGQPIHNTQAYVVDGNQQLVPLGVKGELLLGGAGLARGYLNAEEMTAAKFIPNPFSDDPQSRLYKSGDLVHRQPDGNLVFVGRIDHQVKVRGFRIELGEVETALLSHSGVGNALVMAQYDESQQVRLVAYYTPVDGEVPAEQLRKYLSGHLPDYMMPSFVIMLQSFPLLLNGKIDRNRLPTPELEINRAEYVAPTTDTEKLLVGIWQELLDLEQIGIHDNFFELGGHSLLATSIMLRIKQSVEIDLSLRSLFEAPSIAELAIVIEEHAAEDGSKSLQSHLPAIESSESREQFPLSFAQKRLWFIHQMEGANQAYNIPVAYRVKGVLDSQAVRDALNSIVERHELLRSRFMTVDEVPVQRVMAADESYFMLDEEDLSVQEDVISALDARLGELCKVEFDLSGEHLIRGSLLKLAEDDHVLFIVMHHILADRWSLGLLTYEFKCLYQAFVTGEPSPLPPLLVQFGDYAQWQQTWFSGEAMAEYVDYWRGQLAGAPGQLQVAADYQRPAVQDFSGSAVSLELDETLTEGLRRLSRRHGVSLYMALMAGWGVLLSKLSGEQDIVIGTPSSNRPVGELEGLVGVFINMLAIRLDVSGNPNVKTLLKQVRETFLNAHHYQHLPFEQVVQAVSPARSASYSPLFQVMFSWQSAQEGQSGLDDDHGLSLSTYGLDSTVTAKYDLSLHLEEQSSRIVGSIEFATALFKAETIARYIGYFQKVLEALVSGAEQRVDQIDVLSAVERNELLCSGNESQFRRGTGQRLYQRFEALAQSQPEAIALSAKGQDISYGELNAKANRLACYLIEVRGVKAEQFVGIYTDRSLDMVVSMLAIMKAGGAYVPLDPAYPLSRLQYIIADTGVETVLSQTQWQETPFDDEQVVYIDSAEFEQTLSGFSATDLNAEDLGLVDRQLAYVIYTSGSTGKPKGVMIEHRNADALIEWSLKQYSQDELRCVLASTSMCFDLSVYEIYVTLSSGGQVVVVENILSLIDDSVSAPLSLINTVPSGIRALLDNRALPNSVKTVNLAGEPLNGDLVNRLYDTGVNKVYDLYGPSEDTTYSTFALRERAGENTIGLPIDETQAYVVDAHQKLVPLGVKGELLLGGAGLARGYLNSAAITAEKFIKNPFSDEPDSRLYKTGDLVRRLEDGRLVFIGRLDHQVKVRGFRIELGEVEVALLRHDDINSVLVLPQYGGNEQVRLVAYYTVVDGEVTADTLRRYLLEQLPDYMVPSLMVLLDAFPLLPNGKIDRKALPKPEQDFDLADYVAPTKDTEKLLVDIWQDLLGIEKIGIYDNFFELGGHSLLATRMISRVKESLSVNLPLRDIFTALTIAELAGVIEELIINNEEETDAGTRNLVHIVPSDERDTFPLAFAQSQLWFQHQVNGANLAYNISLGYQLKGKLEFAVVQRALDEIVARHELLRSRFILLNDEPVQQVSKESQFELGYEDLCDFDDKQLKLSEWMERLVSHEFDLSAGPVIFGQLVKMSENQHVLLMVMHHIIADHWSIGLLIEEFKTLYTAFAKGQTNPLAPLALQFGDYAKWQHDSLGDDGIEQQVQYWQNQLVGIPDFLPVPADYQRPPVQDFSGGSIDLLIDEELTAQLRQISREHGVSLYMAMMSAWALLLGKISGEKDIVIGTPSANRPVKDLEQVIGFFINVLPIRVDLSGEPSVAQLLTQVRDTFFAAHDNQLVSFEQVVQAISPARSAAFSPIFQVTFAWQKATTRNVETEHQTGLSVQSYEVDGGSSAKYDLSMHMEEQDDVIVGNLEFATSLFDRTTIERYIAYFQQVLRAVVQDTSAPINQIDIVSRSEYDKLVYDFNSTDVALIEDKCFYQLIEQYGRSTPDAPAVVFNEQQLSYGELNARANQLAHYLQNERGVNVDVQVGVCFERSIEMIISVVAILKAGGAYVPLEPSYPQSRLAYMMEDSQMTTVLTSTEMKDRCDFADDIAVCVNDDTMAAKLRMLSIDSPVNDATPDSLAYVIYTSGSTGKPKGVACHNRGVVSLLEFMQRIAPLPQGARVTQAASFSFDVSVYEVMSALCYGHCLEVIEDNTRMNTVKLFGLLVERQVSSCFLPPVYVGEFTNYLERATKRPPLKRLLVGVESLAMKQLQLIKELLPEVEILNGYGPSESSICCSIYQVRHGIDTECKVAPIGKPVTNNRLYVLDDQMRVVPQGVVGELYIGGMGLARGYNYSPQMTELRFLPSPFVEGDRLYKTGDLLRWNSRGDLEFVGRADQQVKIRGFRIELGEIRHVLIVHPSVDDALVVVQQQDDGDKQLVAYLVCCQESNLDEAATEQLIVELKNQVALTLPNYMMPAAFMPIERIPLTINGKVDQRALPRVDISALSRSKEYVAPKSEMECYLAEVWQQVLDVGQVGLHDNFFELGGHSMMATKIIARLRGDKQIEMAILDIFNYSELGEFAQAVEKQAEQGLEIPAFAQDDDNDEADIEVVEL
ncbi:non-ribosomal peptide synthetase [Idiomarina xiamenensis]|uniref:Non-ribosomal peptide synthetase module n=1 Tax=Idiomarina xiamenensis 10-D-4 TaxID=740709 RepID=K2JZG8_9GAMM|nr:non-ribosomal peptide synthetase [Idiomarina xiamenensis]EKE80853.1 non-ribosomal peptide synthetase module [Idiomarina xiamenensis 10-D-4]